MEFVVELNSRAEKDYKKYAKSGSNLKAGIDILLIIDLLLIILSIDPRGKTNGKGKPERLKYYENREVWARRINDRHRMVYVVEENRVIVHSLWGHYDDK
jgi:toxin YoeB